MKGPDLAVTCNVRPCAPVTKSQQASPVAHLTRLTFGLFSLTGGWLSKDSTKTATESPQLTFSFQAQAQDKSSNTASAWQATASMQHATDEATLLRQALSSFSTYAGLYLAPVLYRPTVQVGNARLATIWCSLSSLHVLKCRLSLTLCSIVTTLAGVVLLQVLSMHTQSAPGMHAVRTHGSYRGLAIIIACPKSPSCMWGLISAGTCQCHS